YRTQPRALHAMLNLYEKYGLEVQTRILGKPLAYLYGDVGELNTYTHMWVYESAGDREQKRAALQQEPQWQEYLRESGEAGYLVHQSNRLMVPAKFAPIGR
ncbi:MAG: NIPSNAP family protein, partial [Rhizobiales bacterium]|nr:NIPSNAP family protein [Hyphomicrobiales bacterium]